jgi:hypothetical protein
MAADGLSVENGQGVIEFLLMLPVLVALVMILVQVNTAIQISIVNQKYARAQALSLAFNSPFYPARLAGNLTPGLGLRELVGKAYNRMIIGVSDNSPDSEEGGGGSFSPKAVVQSVARSEATSLGAGPDKEEPDRRSQVRVRTTVSLCTHSWVIPGQSGWIAFSAAQESLSADFTPQQFGYCRSPRDE